MGTAIWKCLSIEKTDNIILAEQLMVPARDNVLSGGIQRYNIQRNAFCVFGDRASRNAIIIFRTQRIELIYCTFEL
jgi:hypothetical protein